MTAAEYLAIARAEAEKGVANGEQYGGAVIVKAGAVVSKAHDYRQQLNNPIASAEMECIRLAGRRSDQKSLTLYSTNYPDLLTAGTLLQFSIGSLVIGKPSATNAAIDLLRSKAVPVEFYPGAE